MATLINPIGKLSGKIGDFVYSQRNGKTVVSQRPMHYKTSVTQKAVQNRNKFSIASQFSKCANSIPALKTLWKKEYPDVKGSAYNIFLKHFSKCIENNDIAQETCIFPEFGGLDVSITDISFFNNTLTVITDAIDEKSLNINSSEKPAFIQFVGILECSDPFEPNYSKDRFFIPFNLNIIDFVFDEDYIFNIYAVGHEADTISQYQSFRIFSGFIFYDESKTICANSCSFDHVLEASPFG